MVEVVSQMPSGVQVCVTLLVRLGTLHENTGGCDGHVCVTEHETVTVEPASTSGGTEVITGFAGDAEQVKHKAEYFCQLGSQQINSLALAQKNKRSLLIQTFHNNKYAAIVVSDSVISSLCVETEGPIIKGLDVINLQWAVSPIQIP